MNITIHHKIHLRSIFSYFHNWELLMGPEPRFRVKNRESVLGSYRRDETGGKGLGQSKRLCVAIMQEVLVLQKWKHVICQSTLLQSNIDWPGCAETVQQTLCGWDLVRLHPQFPAKKHIMDQRLVNFCIVAFIAEDLRTMFLVESPALIAMRLFKPKYKLPWQTISKLISSAYEENRNKEL